MEVITESSTIKITSRAVASRHVDRTIGPLGFSSNELHDIDFTTSRPPLLNNIIAEQPESRPDSLTKWKFCSNFELPVGSAKLILGCHSCGCVLETFLPLSSGFEGQDSVANPMIRIRVELKLIIAPSIVIAMLEIPLI
jgi:hypothetical protein